MRWVRGLGLVVVGPVGAEVEPVVCGARRGRCCCGGRCRSCELDLCFACVSCVLFRLKSFWTSSLHHEENKSRR
jgi:hypothetical protein